MSGTAINFSSATNPIRAPFVGIVARRVWTNAEKAAYALTVATNNLAALTARYADDCASLGHANRRPVTTRRMWQGRAFRAINATRKQLRVARAALAAAMASPALASDQEAA